MAFEASKRVACVVTRTRGKRRSSACASDSTFEMPTSGAPWRICRCRFVASTTSSSTTPRARTSAAASAKAAEQPRPPAPTMRTSRAPETDPSLKVGVRREIALARVAQDRDDGLAGAELARDVEGDLHRRARRDAHEQALAPREVELGPLRVGL